MEATYTTTAAEVLDGIDLAGRRAVITGATAGLGLETARALVHAGADIVLVGRDAEKLARSASFVAGDAAGQVTSSRMDLGDLVDTGEAAAKLATETDRVDLLVLNAGVMAAPLERTAQGHEGQLAVALLGHHLLTTALLEHLTASQGRVVTLSSVAHRMAPFDFGDPDFTTREYDRWVAYAQSKTATALYALELARRFGPAGVVGTAVHPGVIKTELQRHLAPAEEEHVLAQSAERGELRPVEVGAASIVWAAVAPEVAAANGCYVANGAVANELRAPHASGAEDATRLWDWAEAAVAGFR